ncbi:hypothetical protein ACFQV2_28575 [Actinokineospora soli]|uniref:Uncharacterized protein n=1 Tax=Actinokineospora soli TaxID=1048753 RepID=A0ABW2TSL0_9PSEU
MRRLRGGGALQVLTDDSPESVLRYLTNTDNWEVERDALKHLDPRDEYADVLSDLLRDYSGGGDAYADGIIDLVQSTTRLSAVTSSFERGRSGPIRFKVGVRPDDAPGWVRPLSVAGTIESDGTVRIYHFGPGVGAWH